MLNTRLLRLEAEMRRRKPRKHIIIHMTDWAGNPLPIPEIKGNPRDYQITRIRYVNNWREKPAVIDLNPLTENGEY